MSAIIYNFPSRYSNRCPLGAATGCDVCTAICKIEESDDDTSAYILSVVKRLEKEYLQRRPVIEQLHELLAYKYGVQSIYELDKDALEEYYSDASNLMDGSMSTISPSKKFRELLTYMYGVQSVFDLDSEGLLELKHDVEMLEEEMMTFQKKSKILLFNLHHK